MIESEASLMQRPSRDASAAQHEAVSAVGDIARAHAHLSGGGVDEAFRADPYPTYHAWREAGPIHWSDAFFGGAWLLTRYADVETMLRDPRFSARRTGGWVGGAGASARGELKGFQSLFARAMLFLDAPDHARLRRVMQAGFRPQALQALQPDILAMVDEALEGVDAGAGFDFMQQVARPLPARVIARVMGLDRDAPQAIAWSEDLASFIGAPCPTLEQGRRAQASLLQMSRYFETCLADGAVQPGGLAANLAQAARDGTITDGPELLAQCAMLLFAGHETTRNLLGNGLYHLLSTPGLWAELGQRPDRLPAAVRELLRFDSPVQYTGRRAACDMQLHGQPVRRGDLVLGFIGAANRDPRRYAQPDVLDVERASTASLSFGSGPHVCIGAALTLMEAEAVFARLLQRWPDLRLADPLPRWSGNPVYRGLTALHVVQPGAAG